ncbi:MFS general substrate transporter [Ganoderma sinense ZZ0214-1]|uniref:MFS general substrate transporter n=1 Tax=Ganoderma sinense ZZ0214-1 TaxID=1077348 RepID=A0A2G8RZ80_9APHY|nr:MFS general substrate transporter [Ganoderma sinense ZZ0214-1]
MPVRYIAFDRWPPYKQTPEARPGMVLPRMASLLTSTVDTTGMLAIEGPPLALAGTEKSAPTPYPSSPKDAEEKILIEEVEEAEDCIPDGGLRAWLVVFGVSLGMGAFIGPMNAWGTWQAYYQDNLLQDRSSSDIAWIGSVQSALGYGPGLIVGRLFDMGYFRLPTFISSVLFVACIFLTAECTRYWQFLLCQGFGIGITGGVFFNIGSMVLTHWFKKRLGLALAIAYGGTSVFGCASIHAYGNTGKPGGYFCTFANGRSHLHEGSAPALQWAMRVLGFIILGLLVITNLTAAGRLPGTRNLGPLFNLSEFKKPAYSVYVLSLIINNLALNNALAYITVSAIDEGFDANFSYDLLAIVNAVMTLGQLVGGLLADRYDPLDVLIGSTLLDAVVNFAWPFATNVAALVVITVLIGLSIGGVYASMVQPFERMGRLADVGMRMGMGFTLITGGLVAGSPISGAILDATGSYENVGYYSGSILVLSAALMAATKYLMAKPAEARKETPDGR